MKASVFFGLILSTSYLLCLEKVKGFQSNVDLRHQHGGGVGYDQGYTTIDWLLVANQTRLESLINLRGHLLDNGKFAGNVGCGFRFSVFQDQSLVGINVYYDGLQTPYGFVNQMGFGAEWLSHIIDCRFNLSMPFGRNLFYENKAFKKFVKNTSDIQQNLFHTLSLIQGELGVPFKKVYVALGSYYFREEEKRGISFGNCWGGSIRAHVDLGNYMTLGCSVTYDKIFGKRFQSMLSLKIPFGKLEKASLHKSRNLRCVPMMRQEIIAIQKQEKKQPLLLNENEARRFVFVDNRASADGDGSIEAPFNRLKDAETHSLPGDVIYVFPGDGTSQHMDEGIVLKEDQTLIGSGVDITMDNVEIPAQTPGEKPVITNIHKDKPIIEGSDQNAVKGIEVLLDPWDFHFGHQHFDYERDYNLLMSWGAARFDPTPSPNFEHTGTMTDFGDFSATEGRHSPYSDASSFPDFGTGFNSPERAASPQP